MRWCPTAYNRCLTRDLYGYWNLYIVHRSHFECFFKTSQTNIVHHSLACWVAGVSCPILAFKKDFCPSVIFRHEYISCHEFLGEAYLHILSILHRRGVFPFTNYPGIVASVLYYTAEKQMVMWGESDRGGEDWHQWSQAAFGSGTLQRSWSPRHCGDQGSYTEWMCVCVKIEDWVSNPIRMTHFGNVCFCSWNFTFLRAATLCSFMLSFSFLWRRCWSRRDRVCPISIKDIEFLTPDARL